MPRQVLLTVSGLVMMAAAGGLYLGRQQAALSETEVINAIADHYVAETGGAHSDCVARPAEDVGAWLVISCGTASSISQYWVDRTGRLVTPTAGPDA